MCQRSDLNEIKWWNPLFSCCKHQHCEACDDTQFPIMATFPFLSYLAESLHWHQNFTLLTHTNFSTRPFILKKFVMFTTILKTTMWLNITEVLKHEMFGNIQTTSFRFDPNLCLLDLKCKSYIRLNFDNNLSLLSAILLQKMTYQW